MIRKTAGAAFVLFLALGAVTPGRLEARPVEVNIGFFYDALSPYGEWLTVDPYGWVWCPNDVGPAWRPYMDGDWLYSDDGWVFDASVPWAWACYHYGRWGFNDTCGWFWVPGTVWGPAWVAWRFGGGFIGWAPLPPEVGWSFGMGLQWDGFDMDFGISWPWWSFCEVSRFGERHLDRYVLASGRNMAILRETRNVTRYRMAGGRIVNENVGISEIERATGRTFPRYSIADNPTAAGGRGAQIRGNVLQVYRPEVRSGRPEAPPKNVMPPNRAGVSSQELERRQKQEADQLSQRHRTDREALSQTHRKETPQSVQQELARRHQEEQKALAEQQRKEAQVMENKHKREQQQRQAAQGQSQKSTGSQPVKKKK